MSFSEKFQAGEKYGAAPEESSNFFDDPVQIATGLVNDYVSLRSQASVSEIAGLIEELMHKGQPLDDKKGLVRSAV